MPMQAHSVWVGRVQTCIPISSNVRKPYGMAHCFRACSCVEGASNRSFPMSPRKHRFPPLPPNSARCTSNSRQVTPLAGVSVEYGESEVKSVRVFPVRSRGTRVGLSSPAGESIQRGFFIEVHPSECLNGTPPTGTAVLDIACGRLYDRFVPENKFTKFNWIVLHVVPAAQKGIGGAK